MNPRIAAFASLVASMVLIVTVIVYSSNSSATGTAPTAPRTLPQSSLEELKQLVEMREKERIAKLGPRPVEKIPEVTQPEAKAAPTPDVWDPKKKRYGNYSVYRGRR
mgnify:CR=1 FL=1